MRNCPRAGRSGRAVKVLLIALLSASLSACGGNRGTNSDSSLPASHNSSAATTTSTIARTTGPGGYLKEDADKDGDDGYYPHGPQQDDEHILALYGGRARPAEARTIAALVRRYYVASLAGNGASACALLNPGVVAALVATQGQTARGSSACATAIAPLLAHQHQRLLAENPATMVVIGVYTKPDLGLALLGFRNAPESDIVVAREGNTWRIDSIFDNQLT